MRYQEYMDISQHKKKKKRRGIISLFPKITLHQGLGAQKDKMILRFSFYLRMDINYVLSIYKTTVEVNRN